ncbi:MAG: NifU family protein [Flavobacteriales bacterium]|nr:NifU family protein [Flavobacteriales bacterium]
MSVDEIAIRVSESLSTIRPYLEADGGDISLVEVTSDLTAIVELHGACTTCSMSTMTMKAGVEGAIKSAVPEIRAVRAVNPTE